MFDTEEKSSGRSSHCLTAAQLLGSVLIRNKILSKLWNESGNGAEEENPTACLGVGGPEQHSTPRRRVIVSIPRFPRSDIHPAGSEAGKQDSRESSEHCSARQQVRERVLVVDNRRTDGRWWWWAGWLNTGSSVKVRLTNVTCYTSCRDTRILTAVLQLCSAHFTNCRVSVNFSAVQ